MAGEGLSEEVAPEQSPEAEPSGLHQRSNKCKGPGAGHRAVPHPWPVLWEAAYPSGNPVATHFRDKKTEVLTPFRVFVYLLCCGCIDVSEHRAAPHLHGGVKKYKVYVYPFHDLSTAGAIPSSRTIYLGCWARGRGPVLAAVHHWCCVVPPITQPCLPAPLLPGSSSQVVEFSVCLWTPLWEDILALLSSPW
jgi:hypothetical protein